tara:strand:+ start:210 stop:416 length:207 start_codon:yes stop_codon:yes gene_type:complete
MKNEFDHKAKGEEMFMQIMTSDDPDLLRSAALEMVIVVGTIYRRMQIHMLLHPLFFLAGFLTCYYLIK